MQLKRLDEEENSSIQIDDDEDDGRAGASGDDDDDAKIPLLTSPEVISRVACDSIHRLRISWNYYFFVIPFLRAPFRSVSFQYDANAIIVTILFGMLYHIVASEKKNSAMIYGFIALQALKRWKNDIPHMAAEERDEDEE